MTCHHFNALVERQSKGRSARQIARDAEIPVHWIAYYLRPDTVLGRMPIDERIDGIGRALGVSSAEVREVFRHDLGAEPQPALERELAVLWEGMSAPYRRSLMQMARSLSHLERSVARGDTPDLGDDRAAV